MTATFSRFDYIDAARATGEQFARLAESIPEPGCRINTHRAWTIDDCVGFVATEPAHFLGLARGESTWTGDPLDLPEHRATRAASVNGTARRSVTGHTRRLLDDLDALLDTVSHLGARVPMSTCTDGRRVRADAALGILIGEFLVYGHDIARTVGAPWEIDPAVVPLVARGRHQILSGWLNRTTTAGHTATYDIRLRGTDERFVYEFTDGQLAINPDEHRTPDVYISADPVVSMLSAVGRFSSMRALLTGKAIAWGPRPWLAPGLPKKFLPI